MIMNNDYLIISSHSLRTYIYIKKQLYPMTYNCSYIILFLITIVYMNVMVKDMPLP